MPKAHKVAAVPKTSKFVMLQTNQLAVMPKSKKVTHPIKLRVKRKQQIR